MFKQFKKIFLLLIILKLIIIKNKIIRIIIFSKNE